MSDDEATPERSTNQAQPSRRGLMAAGVGLGAAALAAEAAAQTRPNGSGRFAGRAVLITGATSGIGEGVARAFAAEGARVMFCGRREALGRQVAASVNAAARTRAARGEASFMRADVRRPEDVQALVDACVRRYGTVEIAFNNAGIGTDDRGRVHEQSVAHWTDVMATNPGGVFLAMRAEAPVMLRNSPWGAFGTRGVIINTSSTSGHVGFPTISPYSASKHAIMGLTKCAALEYSPDGIRVNSISPGGVETPMRNRAYAGRTPQGQPDPAAPNLYRRTNRVEEMAEVVLFLASDAASSITGTDLDVTGGYHTGAHLTQPRTG